MPTTRQMETGVNCSFPQKPSSGPPSASRGINKEPICDDDPSMLPSDFEPGETDVICQRGKESFEHAGNKIFRELIDKHIASYLEAASRHEKSTIVAKIYDRIRHDAVKPSTGFVRKDLLTRRWFVVNEKEARDKVGQALRDAIKIIRSTSKKGKSETIASKTSKTSLSSNDSTLRSRDTCRKRPISSISSGGEKFDGSGMESKQNRSMRRADHIRAEGNTPFSIGSRLFENQSKGIGQSLLGAKLRSDELNGLAVSTMLESSIEPLETTNINKRNIPISSDSCVYPNTFASERLQQSYGFLQDSMTHAKLSPQLSASSDSPETVEARIPAQDQSSSAWQVRMNTPFSAASFLPALGAGASFFPVHPSSEQNPQQQGNTKQTASTGPWDLEPTPLNVEERSGRGNDQRAAALARLLFHEESYL